ncbi:MAG: hypothetical protein PHH69_03730 [Candidatus Omnitrophica bacterium]|nr:hypothetical protein [Candidatus Omnitrophota bacterium]
MGLFSVIGNWINSLFNKAKAFIQKAWSLLGPFAKEVLSETAQEFLDSSKTLLLDAVQYVAQQGFPSSEAKRKAFTDYMALKAKDEWKDLKESEQDLLRQIALSIWKKATEQNK